MTLGGSMSFKSRLSTSVAMMAVVVTGAVSAPHTAQAQTAPAAAPAVDEIVVTGTRVVRDGYEAPTPLTVLGSEALEAAAPENIADLVNDLPSVVGSASPQTSNLSFSNGQAGLNTLNLRGLGGNRTLVLLDGQRSVPSTITGLVDVNDFPQQLISRVDIVTGGASAAYGSDALSGVVNFVLNKDFTGVKGEVSGGLTTYGDDPAAKVALSSGTSFANGRGHFLASGEWSRRWGIFSVPREWNNQGWTIVTNPAYGTGAGQSQSVPQRLLLSGVGLGTATPGGIITNTALRGTYFGPGGTPAQFNYGSIVSDPFTQGGDWKSTQVNFYNTLDQRVTREGIFLRTSYDISDNVTAFAQGQWGHARSIGLALKQFNVANLIIRTDNAFIPSSVQQRALALGLTQFTLGSMNVDMPTITFDNERTVNRYVVGFNGAFDAMNTEWTWDAYFQKGVSRTSENGLNVSAKAEFGAAIDAVRTANGTIACRVNTDAITTNDRPGCVPYNVMGLGVNSQAAINYVFASPEHPQRNQRFAQDVYAFTLNGEPFSIWAGPVSLALGAEHRKEAVRGRADPISLINGWFAGNYLPTFGGYNVTEGFAETVVPLAKDEAWADALDLNAAVRATSYSTSGMVVTWKVGATYQPMSDIRFRVTRSRDIRAPNLNDLYQAGTANTNNVTDRFNNNALTLYQGLQVGNTALEPEKADTTGIGVVVSPSFVPGFTVSADYYNINIKGGINTVPAQTIVDRCFEGVSQFCAAITRGVNSSGANVITQIRLQPFNFAASTARGLDLEASYTMPLDTFSDDMVGNVSIRALATRYIKNYTNDGINPEYDTVGLISNTGSAPPKWVYNVSLAYNADPIMVNLTGRGMSGGIYAAGNYGYIACTTGCPVATVAAPTINTNRIAGAFYLDLGLKYEFMQSDEGLNAEMFLNINNLLNKDPPVVAQGPGGFPYAAIPANPALHDVLGRMFRAGIRFQM